MKFYIKKAYRLDNSDRPAALWSRWHNWEVSGQLPVGEPVEEWLLPCPLLKSVTRVWGRTKPDLRASDFGFIFKRLPPKTSNLVGPRKWQGFTELPQRFSMQGLKRYPLYEITAGTLDSKGYVLFPEIYRQPKLSLEALESSEWPPGAQLYLSIAPALINVRLLHQTPAATAVWQF